MFPQQQLLNNHLSQIQQWQQTYQLNPQIMAELAPQIQHFQLRVPLIGTFSVGKSSLLNSFINDKLLSLDITPETGIATELHYSIQENLIGHQSDGQAIPLTRQQLSHNETLSHLAPDGWIKAHITAEVLQRFPHICLVDLPGLSSGLEIHNKAIDHYIDRSLAYCIVVSVENGELNQSTQDFLAELKLHNKPIILVLSKSDKRPPEQVEEVQTKVTNSVKQLLDDSPLYTIAVSTRQKSHLQTEFSNALHQLEQQAEKVFQQHITNRAINELTILKQQIQLLSNQDDLNSEALMTKRENLQKEMLHFQQQLEHQTHSLNHDLPSIANNIASHVKNALMSNRDSLASMILHNNNINHSITQTVRVAVTEGLQRDFLPRINRYICRIENELPLDIRIDNEFKLNNIDSNNLFTATTISTALMPLLTKFLPHILRFLGPYGTVVATALSTITSLFLSNKQQEETHQQQLEEARQIISHEVIPQAIEQITPQLLPYLQEQVQIFQQQINQVAKNRSQELQAALQQLTQQLQADKVEFERVRQTYLNDLAQVEQLILALHNAYHI